MKKSIYELKLNESLFIIKPDLIDNSDSTKVTRVPGGWIYTECSQGIGEKEISVSNASVFVPYNEEFKPNNTERF